MRICLCDDDSNQLEYLQHIIGKWQQQSNEHCDIFIYHSAEELLFENEDSFPFDVMILDIQMGHINGITLAKRIREHDKKVVIIFLSGISDYVFEGYEVSALRYLLKPLKEEQLFQILNNIKGNQKEDNKYMVVWYQGFRKKIDLNEIIYIESLGHYITIYTNDGQYEQKKPISEVFNELKGSSFISTHRSYLVNLNHIDQITRTDCILSNKKLIPISRNCYKDVNDTFIKFYKGES